MVYLLIVECQGHVSLLIVCLNTSVLSQYLGRLDCEARVFQFRVHIIHAHMAVDDAAIVRCAEFRLADAMKQAYAEGIDDMLGDGLRPEDASPTLPSSTLVSVKQSAAHTRRKACRQRQKEALGHPPTRQTIDRIVHDATSSYIDIGMPQMRHIRGAMTGPRARPLFDVQPQPRQVAELLNQGFEYISSSGKPLVLLDQHYRLFACFTGYPHDLSYLTAVSRAFDLIMELSNGVRFSGTHKWGSFPAINFGIHHSIGLKAPCRLKLTQGAAHIVGRLTSDPDIQHIAHFDSCQSLSLPFPL